ncbi:ceramidase domain-containing protein [Granulosicoccus antarcticus]|uniref:Ceramidase n=1 Tax=Granulosicoccus antarcticus IMCC3135 TaxID=1192854 RepID=A0A2Z2NTW5_9GAMM|nr:ceramidase domain-containing protein [Granulosicoccus antarcticus]ASJ70554.1 hypothetical protein IMCC3135_02200 [Granulosicoccus antarcticus IMCC3135]
MSASAALIDLYCERTSAELWNEPLNALSNIAFVLAAIFAWRWRARRQQGDIWEALLIVLAGSIGVGSFLFHVFANSWSQSADVIPIWSFVAGYALLTIYRSTEHNLTRTLRISGIAMFVTIGISYFTGQDIVSVNATSTLPLNGSLQYAPALAALLIFSIIAWLRAHPAKRHMAVASLVFCTALLFRTIDLTSCEATLGMGTHFVWHLLNGLMVGILLHAMIVRMPPIKRHI